MHIFSLATISYAHLNRRDQFLLHMHDAAHAQHRTYMMVIKPPMNKSLNQLYRDNQAKCGIAQQNERFLWISVFFLFFLLVILGKLRHSISYIVHRTGQSEREEESARGMNHLVWPIFSIV